MVSPHEEFIELMTENCKVNGLDELTSRIMSHLYASPKELCLDELAEMCGYSLSAVSTAMKLLERAELVKRIRKKGSRKAFFFMEKNLMNYAIELLEKKYERIILKSKQVLPGIIASYKAKKLNDEERKKLKIIEDYYHQLLFGEKLMEKALGLFGKINLKEKVRLAIK
jgi:DNA-binding transcriptional regulator GbsR (MarR family)